MRNGLNRLFGPAAVLLVAWAMLLIDTGAVASASALYEAAEVGNPYFVPRHAVLLYVRVPLVTLSACVLILSPGLILARALGRDQSLDRLVIYGFGLSLVVLAALTSTLTAIGIAPSGRGFATVLALTSLAALVVLAQARSSAVGRIEEGVSPATLASYAVPVLILVAALAPKFLWESFNGDGAHGFEASRLLLHGPLPFWDPAAGAVSRFPGLTTMLFTFPASWFIRLFGEVEAAVRLPFVLHLVALYAAICALVRSRRGSVLVARDRWLLWLGLAAYTLVMAFSASYNPYHADIALPGAQDTLFLACLLAFMGAFADEDLPGLALFLVLSALALPSWAVLIGLWLAAVVLLWRPIPWRTVVFAGGMCVLVVLALAVVPRVLARLPLPAPGVEHTSGQLLERFQYVRLTDWQRWLFLIVPGGILPALYLIAWKRQDAVARALTIVAVGYFLFFYVQAYTSLHHFLPAAVIPMATLWRDDLQGAGGRRLRIGALGLGVLAVVLALPANSGIHLHGKHVGYSIEDRRGGYDEGEPGSFSSGHLYWTLFGRILSDDVPDAGYGGSPLVWNYYSNHAPENRRAAYVITAAASPSPPGGILVASDETADLYVLDESVWERDRNYVEEGSLGRLFAIPKTVLFRAAGAGADEGVHDLSGLVRRLRGDSR
ncbi:MAG: hypothetical protein OEU54_08835 [Gemmatimonadota bacterium]|nr:hypothetical protein [Gemmatimonadota bacterium]